MSVGRTPVPSRRFASVRGPMPASISRTPAGDRRIAAFPAEPLARTQISRDIGFALNLLSDQAAPVPPVEVDYFNHKLDTPVVQVTHAIASLRRLFFLLVQGSPLRVHLAQPLAQQHASVSVGHCNPPISVAQDKRAARMMASWRDCSCGKGITPAYALLTAGDWY